MKTRIFSLLLYLFLLNWNNISGAWLSTVEHSGHFLDYLLYAILYPPHPEYVVAENPPWWIFKFFIFIHFWKRELSNHTIHRVNWWYFALRYYLLLALLSLASYYYFFLLLYKKYQVILFRIISTNKSNMIFKTTQILSWRI